MIQPTGWGWAQCFDFIEIVQGKVCKVINIEGIPRQPVLSRVLCVYEIIDLI